MTASIIIVFHFLLDWIAQPRHIAESKKDDFKALMIHLFCNVCVYLAIISFWLFQGSLNDMITFFAINFISHGLIDWYLPKGRNMAEMISWTAIDQILHLAILFGTLDYFGINLNYF